MNHLYCTCLDLSFSPYPSFDKQERSTVAYLTLSRAYRVACGESRIRAMPAESAVGVSHAAKRFLLAHQAFTCFACSLEICGARGRASAASTCELATLPRRKGEGSTLQKRSKRQREPSHRRVRLRGACPLAFRDPQCLRMTGPPRHEARRLLRAESIFEQKVFLMVVGMIRTLRASTTDWTGPG